MTPARDREGRAFVDRRPAPALLRGDLGQAGGHVQTGQGRGGQGNLVLPLQDFPDQVVEQLLLQRQGLVGGAGDLALKFAEFDGGEAHGVGHGLAMDEGSAGGAPGLFGPELFGVTRRDLDEVAQHVVVLDLQGGDAALAGVAGL